MLEELFNRVSIRHYQNREVEQAKLEEMLRAAMNAPTARNTQSWRFLVIKNRETLNHMTELQPYTGMMKEAYCAILVMGGRNANPVDEYLYVDAAAAIENMLIEGVHQGLGTCWCAVGPSKERISKFKSISIWKIIYCLLLSLLLDTVQKIRQELISMILKRSAIIDSVYVSISIN